MALLAQWLTSRRRQGQQQQELDREMRNVITEAGHEVYPGETTQQVYGEVLRDKQQAAQRAEIQQNALDRKDKLRKTITNGFNAYSTAVKANLSPAALRTLRGVIADNMEGAGYTVPENFRDMTDAKQLQESGEKTQFEQFNMQLEAWQKDPGNDELSREVLGTYGSLNNNPKFKDRMAIYPAAFANIRTRAKEIRAQELRQKEAEKGKTELGQTQRTFEISQYGAVGKGPKRGSEQYRKDFLKYRKAGVPSMTQIISGEKFEFQKMVTAANAKTNMKTNQTDKNVYEANVSIFNTTNKQNEIAYWDIVEWGRDRTKIMKLTSTAIKAGWTPQKIQDAANSKGITTKQVLIELGIIK